MKLSFSNGNAKLAKGIYTFSLPSGHTCPGALTCLSKANRATGKIQDGPQTSVRCFSASQEALHTNVRKSRWRNFELLRAAGDSESMAALILDSLPPKAKLVRVHVGGDFFSLSYFRAWMLVAQARPAVQFYAYTKSLRFVEGFGVSNVPVNFKLTLSTGGKFDALIPTLGIKTARIVNSTDEAAAAGLDIDHDDSAAYSGGKDFALLIHGTQPAGSVAAKAWQAVKKTVGGYSRAKQKGGA